MRPEGLCQRKIPMISPEIEPVWLVKRRLQGGGLLRVVLSEMSVIASALHCSRGDTMQGAVGERCGSCSRIK